MVKKEKNSLFLSLFSQTGHLPSEKIMGNLWGTNPPFEMPPASKNLFIKRFAGSDLQKFFINKRIEDI